MIFVKCSATSGRAAFRALESSLEDVTRFQVTLYSPALSSSTSPIWALSSSLMASASASASSMKDWSCRSSLTLLSKSQILILTLVREAGILGITDLPLRLCAVLLHQDFNSTGQVFAGPTVGVPDTFELFQRVHGIPPFCHSVSTTGAAILLCHLVFPS